LAEATAATNAKATTIINIVRPLIIWFAMVSPLAFWLSQIIVSRSTCRVPLRRLCQRYFFVALKQESLEMLRRNVFK
jgi:hypothetical protein